MDRIKLDKAKAYLKEYGQEQLLRFINELSEVESERLIDQILSIDFDKIKQLYQMAVSDNDAGKDKLNISPIPCTDISDMTDDERQKYIDIGNKAIANGEVAAVTVAGGQGSRLGYEGPKGSFEIGLPSKRSLFNILLDRLKSVSSANNTSIPWYIMTSEENDKQTKEYFMSNNYFGYNKDDIIFFKQGQLPIIGTDGKVLLKSKSEICMGSDGHGGVLNALLVSGALEDMKRRGVKWVFKCGIDNVLVRMADPLFVGFSAFNDKECTSKSIIKRDPYEKAGVFCYNNGKPAVIEYTELTDEIRFSKDDNDGYIYGDINILSYVFKLETLFRIANVGLPYHTAFKKVKCIDCAGNPLIPDKENGYKFETFIFDVLPRLDDMAILRTVREQEFAPVKNKTGEDSPESARKLMLDLGER